MEKGRKGRTENSFFRSAAILKQRWKEGTFGEIIDDWRWIFTYTKKHKWAVLFYTVLGILSTTMSLVASVAGKYLIDIITGYKTDKLGLLILITVGSAAVSLLFSSIIGRLSLKISIRINNDIQADIFDRIVDMDWRSINSYSNGDLLNRFGSDVGTVSQNAINWLPSVIVALYNFIVTFFVIWHYNKVMSLLAFASAPVMLLMSKYLIGKQRERAKEVREISSRFMGFQVETFTNFDTIKSFGIMDHYGRRLRGWQEEMKESTLRYNLFSIKTNIFMSVLGMIVQYAAFGYCLFLLWNHQITYGTMTMFLEQRSRLSNSFNGVVGIVPSFLTSSVAANRIRELMEQPGEKHLPESGPFKDAAEEGVEVHMEDVTFSYEEDSPVFTVPSFNAAPGEMVALIGPSGDGKTTMIRLILGLVYPNEGRAFLRAKDGTELDMNADIRALYSYVPQGNTILSGTVAENMRMVKEDASDEEITEALKTACAWEFIGDHEDGINRKVGERGRGFSEGQAQRLSIARALLRDAPVLLLDEATSALDNDTEKRVLENISAKYPEKTCIITTHRTALIDRCDRIYKVEDSVVSEVVKGISTGRL
jgi:ABC-type multidrug transport system fused ATPase/permease subunit